MISSSPAGVRNPLRISEIFGPTIQGEGALSGRPTVFVRTGGCDYRCAWCVAPHSQILTADRQWVPAGEIQAGTEILGTARRDKAFPEGPEPLYGVQAMGGYQRGTVLGTVSRKAPRARIHFEDAPSVEVSTGHRFTRFDTGCFIAADQLSPGDRLSYLGSREPTEREPPIPDHLAPTGWPSMSQGGERQQACATVATVASIEAGEVVSIKTDLGTYVADGLLARNCDSLFAVLPEHRKQWQAWRSEEVLAEIDRLAGTPILVTLSGGNPALQDLGPLITAGHARGHSFALETQGSMAQPWFAELDHLTLSPKGPSSGHLTGLAELETCLEAAQEHPETVFKVVIFDNRDYTYAHSLAANYRDYPFYLQIGNPEPEGEPSSADLMARFRWLAHRMLADRWYSARLLPQLHVLAWGNQRGV